MKTLVSIQAGRAPKGCVTAGRGVAATLALLLGGCAAVGPNYGGPPPVADASLKAAGFHRAATAPVSAVPPPARWWEAVGDPTLTRLVDDAFAASPTLAAAVARVRSARAQLAQNRAGLGPTGSVGGRYVKGKIPTGSIAGGAGGGAAGGGAAPSLPEAIDLDSFSVTTNATWELDIFGGTRRGIESAGAAADASQAAVEDAQVSLASDVAQAYAQLREAQNRLALANRTVRLRTDSLALTNDRRAHGTAADGDVDRAEAELAQAAADVPQLQITIDQQLDQLAILAGRAPGAYDALLGVPDDRQVAQPKPPDAVPVGEPADWLRRRPDIRQAERTLASRNATIGRNVAALFPTVSVLGFLGTSGANVGDLFKGSPLWLVTPSLSWNFLSIPANRARVRGAEADRDASLADYQRTVLAALQDANGSLSRFGRQRQAVAQLLVARDAAARAAGKVRDRYRAGTASLIDALDSERQRVQTEDQWIQGESRLMVAYVSVNKSLGLGWGAAPPEEGATARASDGVAAAADGAPPNAGAQGAAGGAVRPAGAASAGAVAAGGPAVDAGDGLSGGSNTQAGPGAPGGTGTSSGSGSGSR